MVFIVFSLKFITILYMEYQKKAIEEIKLTTPKRLEM